MKNLLYALLLFSVISCKKETFLKSEKASVHTIPDKKFSDPADSIKDIQDLNRELLTTLKDKNYGYFVEKIHPEKGIRFSMYAFVSPDDKHFSKKEFAEYLPSNSVFTWGEKDGSGEIYQAKIGDYLAKWVFVKDFTKAKVTVNVFQAGGNSLNNLRKMYPNADFTENYLLGTEKYGGMDWNTLRFVFEKWNGKYYLVGVVNDQWTI